MPLTLDSYVSRICTSSRYIERVFPNEKSRETDKVYRKVVDYFNYCACCVLGNLKRERERETSQTMWVGSAFIRLISSSLCGEVALLVCEMFELLRGCIELDRKNKEF